MQTSVLTKAYAFQQMGKADATARPLTLWFFSVYRCSASQARTITSLYRPCQKQWDGRWTGDRIAGRGWAGLCSSCLSVPSQPFLGIPAHHPCEEFLSFGLINRRLAMWSYIMWVIDWFLVSPAEAWRKDNTRHSVYFLAYAPLLSDLSCRNHSFLFAQKRTKAVVALRAAQRGPVDLWRRAKRET